MNPGDTIRTWFNKVQKDANLESNNDSPANPEEAPSHPHVSDKTAPQVCSPDDYLHGFQVALELRAKELEWPEHEELVALTAAEMGEEGRKKVMDERYFLDIGYELVNQFLQDFETAKPKVEKKAAEARAEEASLKWAEEWRHMTWLEGQKILEEIAKEEAQQAAQENANNKDSGPDPDATPTCVGETADSSEAQSRPSDDTQQATPKEAEVTSKEAEGAPKEADQEANLSAQEPQAFEEAGVAAEDPGKERLDTGIGTVVPTQEAKSKYNKHPVPREPPLVENRPLHDQSLYKKVGKEYWVLVEGQWTISRHSEQWNALFGLHRILLHEQYDFLLVSQHHIASAALKRLPAKYAMPARMWKHGIHSFLDVMRVRLFESHEFMESFIILGYSMMSLLDETVPQFLPTWIECKADLARYG